MIKQYVFCVHGIGDWDHKAAADQSLPQWVIDWRDALWEIMQRYRYFRYLELDDVIEFLPITYNDHFLERITQWSDLSTALLDLGPTGPGMEALSWIRHLDANQAESDLAKFFWSHGLDVALWWLSAHDRNAIIAKVVGQLDAGLNQILDTDATASAARIHLFAHSMGTSVGHDAIAVLAGNEKTAKRWGPSKFRFGSVHQIANVSRLLEPFRAPDDGIGLDGFRAYRSLVRPQATSAQTGACLQLLNYANVFDPITWPCAYRPMFWDGANFSPLVEDRLMDPKQVHEFRHYIESPRFHVPMLRALYGRDCVTAKEKDEAVAAWVRKSVGVSGDYDRLREIWSGDPDFRLGVIETLDIIKRYREVLS